mmetsp:Transcript_16838/g.24367  ORF Transcript_16838/g.24367 Transcript_16838/m.24367 type:complete len:361 (+) Transcript_16838:748-1830(+)
MKAVLPGGAVSRVSLSRPPELRVGRQLHAERAPPRGVSVRPLQDAVQGWRGRQVYFGLTVASLGPAVLAVLALLPLSIIIIIIGLVVAGEQFSGHRLRAVEGVVRRWGVLRGGLAVAAIALLEGLLDGVGRQTLQPAGPHEQVQQGPLGGLGQLLALRRLRLFLGPRLVLLGLGILLRALPGLGLGLQVQLRVGGVEGLGGGSGGIAVRQEGLAAGSVAGRPRAAGEGQVKSGEVRGEASEARLGLQRPVPPELQHQRSQLGRADDALARKQQYQDEEHLLAGQALDGLLQAREVGAPARGHRARQLVAGGAPVIQQGQQQRHHPQHLRHPEPLQQGHLEIPQGAEVERVAVSLLAQLVF